MIGVFGGTFDPVHYGHIRPALSVKEALGLSELRFIPNRNPPHRAQPWLSAGQRLALLHTAVDGIDGVVVDERELQREGPSYMVDTLASLHHEHPDEGLCLIIGMDAFLDIDRWHQWQRLFDYALLVVTHRPGFVVDDVLQHFSPSTADFIRPRLVDSLDQPGLDTPDCDAPGCDAVGKILIQSVPQLDISSTQIRNRLESFDTVAARELAEWMPAKVLSQLRQYK
jgi:nicotinate-nucleotide adenylyltransferase